MNVIRHVNDNSFCEGMLFRYHITIRSYLKKHNFREGIHETKVICVENTSLRNFFKECLYISVEPDYYSTNRLGQSDHNREVTVLTYFYYVKLLELSKGDRTSEVIINRRSTEYINYIDIIYSCYKI